MLPLSAETLQHDVWPYLFCANLLLAALLAWFKPMERRTVGLTLVFMVLGLCGYGLTVALTKAGIVTGVDLIRELVMVQLGMVVIRLWGLGIFRLFFPALRVTLPRILEDIIVIVGYLVWGLVRLRAGGLEVSHLVVTSTVITAVIGFSMQDTLGNILSGLAVQLDNSLEIGHWVKVGDQSGRVCEIGWRSTLIQTRNGEIIVMPNSWMMKNGFQLLGIPIAGDKQGLRRWVWFNIGWEHNAANVVGILQQAVLDAQLEDVALDPPPQAVLMELKQGVARYALRYWLTNFQRDDPTDSLVRIHVITALKRHGIELEAENYNLTTTKENEKTGQARAEHELAQRLQMLGEVSLFAGITQAEREQLAPHLRYAPFESGDIISRQGAIAHWLYLIISGKVEIWQNYGMPDAHKFSELEQGNFFGEMGMMTGAPRSATVVACGHVECYRLDREGFQAIISARPEIADAISKVLAERVATNAFLQNTATGHPVPAHAELLERIRHFFGL